MKFFFNILFGLLFFAQDKVQAQEMYSTQTGTIQFSFSINDSAYTAVSKQLIVLLDYETANFILSLNPATIQTGIDSLDKKLKTFNTNVLKYEGKMAIEYIDTESHPPQDFEVDGHIISSSEYPSLNGKGHLEHIFGGTYSCLLNLSFKIQADDFQTLKQLFPEIGSDIYIEVIETVLDKEYNKE